MTILRRRTKASRRRVLALLLTAALLTLPSWGTAIPTAAFKVSTFEDFDQGKPKGTLISSEAEVLAGRQAKRIKAEKGITSPMFWTTARDGKTVFFGTGDPGTIIAVRGGKMRTVAKMNTVLVTALTVGRRGKLIAGIWRPDQQGTSGHARARVVEVDTRSGKWRQLAKLPAAHVWALAFDSKRRTIFAATGAPGKVFAIPAGGGKPTVYYDPGEKQLLSMVLERRGSLLVGSNDKAIIYRVTKKGRASAVHDFQATEVRDLVVTKSGVIYAAINKFRRKTSGLPRYDRQDKNKGGTPLGVTTKKKKAKKKGKVRAAELRPGAKSGSGALYRIDADGRIDELLVLKKGYFTDLALDRAGVLWAADGTEGKVYLVRPDRTIMTAFDLDQRQVLSLAVDGAEQYLGTGDSGAVYQIAGTSPKAAYQTKVFDAKFVSRWGAVHYRATGKLRMESRSGNTAKPDKTWSDWRPSRVLSERRFAITSGAARYLQLRVIWADYKSALRHLEVYYRPQNQRTRVTSIEFSRKRKKGKPRTPTVSIKWKVQNPDKDPLVYRLYFRQEMGIFWQRIKTSKPVVKSQHKWNTETVPDGHYRVKIVASDERGNGQEHKLLGNRISAPLLVDNRKPEVVGLSVTYPWAVGMARDSYSTIKSIEYAIDGGQWKMVSARDGIYDSAAENFRIRLPQKLQTAPHLLAVRVRDDADNAGVSSVRFIP